VKIRNITAVAKFNRMFRCERLWTHCCSQIRVVLLGFVIFSV